MTATHFVRGGIGVLLFLFCISTNALDLANKWQTADGKEWYFTDNTLGKKFRYTDSQQRITGSWELKGNQLQLSYKTNDVSTEPKIKSDTLRIDSLGRDTIIQRIIPQKLPIPAQYNLQDHGNGHLGFSAKGQSYQLSQVKPSALATIFSNGILRGFLCIFVLLFLAFLLSSNRKAIDWRLVGMGIGLQILFAIGILKVQFIYEIFAFISRFFVNVLAYTEKGSTFVFGDLGTGKGTLGFNFAFQVLPTIIFFSALSSVLYYLGILQKIVYGFAWVMVRLMRLSGAESLAAAANIFIGQTEAPLVVRPFLDRMSRSEIMCLMTGGMATIAGGVFVSFIGILGGDDPAQKLFFATHLLSASIMSAPAAIVAAKILVPETNKGVLDTDLNIPKDNIGSNLLDAITNGTTEGLKLAVNVGAMLIAFYGLIAMIDSIFFDVIGYYTGLNDIIANKTSGQFDGFRLNFIFGLLFAPIAWLLGVPATDVMSIGQLLGQKTIINEFVAYITLGDLKNAGVIMEEKSLIIATYALCGFANFASIGIQIGGIGALSPKQRPTLSQLGILALIGGTIACFLTAAVAGMLIG